MPDRTPQEALDEIDEAIDHIRSVIKWAAASEEYAYYVDRLADANKTLSTVQYQIKKSNDD